MRKIVTIFLLILLANKGIAQGGISFSADMQEGCIPFVVNFSANTGAQNISSWRWDFGDGNVSLQATPTYVYTTSGTYTVKLRITLSNGQIDSVVKVNYITASSVPIVNFTANELANCIPDTIQFSNNIINGNTPISTTFWDFGDGTTSNEPNPKKVYTLVDTFSVLLTVTNVAGCSSIAVKPNYILTKPKPIVNFSVTPSDNCNAPKQVAFTNTTTGSGTLSYNWSFGNGTNSTIQNAMVVYNTNGEYTPKLTVVSSNGCMANKIYAPAIKVGGYNAVINAVNSTCVGNTFTASNQSTPTPATSTWSIAALPTQLQGNLYSTVFTAPGNYTLQLVNDHYVCKDTVTKNIVVSSGIDSVLFSADIEKSVCFPINISFLNRSTQVAGASYLWDFGDGGTSTELNPQHIYSNIGFYTVSLTITLPNGCVRKLEYLDYIRIQSPALINIEGTSGCAPVRSTITAAVSSIEPVVKYIWNYGDGTVDTTTTFYTQHSYNNLGAYNVSVQLIFRSGCVIDASTNNPVFAAAKPNANFTYAPTSACASQSFSFNNLSTNATEYEWAFYNNIYNANNTTTNPTITFRDTGWLNVRLVAFANGCKDTAIITNALYVIAPYADFKVTTVCNNNATYTKKFTNTSKARPNTNFLWDFGDGITSSDTSLEHSYLNAGNYTVTLTAISGPCASTKTFNLVIGPRPEIIATKTNPCRNEQIAFRVRQQGQTPSYIIWNFGDGTTALSPQNAVSMRYTNFGLYTIQAEMFNEETKCNDTITRASYVNVTGPVASLQIDSTLTQGCTGLQVKLSPVSNAGGTAIAYYNVNWGDLTTNNYTFPPFTHTYTSAGTFSIAYDVGDSRGCTDRITYPNLISSSVINTNFVANATVSCPLAGVDFTNLTVGGSLPIKYTWLLGNGQVLNTFNASTNYSSVGNYTVRLVSEDANGCKDTAKKVNYISIVQPKASFTANDSSIICTPAIVNFNFTGLNAAITEWQFGDGSISNITNPTKTYTNFGSYRVKLLIYSPGGCKDSASKTIVVSNPSPTYALDTTRGCMPLRIHFLNSSFGGDKYVWLYGDGYTAYNTSIGQLHIYEKPGQFTPQLFIIDNAVCKLQMPITDTIKVYGVISNFTALQQSKCDSSKVQFTPTILQSYTNVNEYKWLLGNGTTSTVMAPTVNYNQPGSYTVKLITTTTEGCKDTTIKSNIVQIATTPKPTIQMADAVCQNVPVNILATIAPIDTAIMQYSWLVNGQIINQNVLPPQTFSINGNTTVGLTVTNTLYGCKSSTEKMVYVNAKPVASFFNTPVCVNTQATFTDNSTVSSDTIIKYNWRINNVLVGTSKLLNYIFNNAGTYIVSLTVQSVNGCESQISKTFIISSFNTRIIADSLAAENEPFNLTVSNNPLVNIVAYNWLPTSSVSNPTAANTIGKLSISSSVKVLLTDDKGCTGADSIYIKVFKGGADIFVPTAFAPNGVNNVLRPTVVGAKLKYFRVFNRYGQMIFESNETNFRNGWNGKINGVAQSTGTYVWMAEAKLFSGETIIRKGTAVLIR